MLPDDRAGGAVAHRFDAAADRAQTARRRSGMLREQVGLEALERRAADAADRQDRGGLADEPVQEDAIEPSGRAGKGGTDRTVFERRPG